MPSTAPPASATPGGMIRLTLLLLWVGMLGSGCVNMGVMAGKMLFGNPKATSAFEQRTGISLRKQKRKVAVICTAPTAILSEFDGLGFDVQEEVARRMRLKEISVASDDDVTDALNRAHGRFDKDVLAGALDDVEFIIHVDVEQFTATEDGNPGLYRGRASGVIYAYEVTRDLEKTARPRTDKVFFQEFNTTYPAAQPIAAENMSARVFHQKCVDQLAELVGRTFYDVDATDLFN
jgi:hypothetical protein